MISPILSLDTSLYIIYRDMVRRAHISSFIENSSKPKPVSKKEEGFHVYA